MKAITVWQPYASFLVLPAKENERPKIHETRTRPTKHIGPLLIHAAKREPPSVRESFLSDPVLRFLLGQLRFSIKETELGGWFTADQIFDMLPRGCIVGMVDCHGSIPAWSLTPKESDLALGNFSNGRFAYSTSRPRQLVNPIPWKGQRGMWSVPDEALLLEPCEEYS